MGDTAIEFDRLGKRFGSVVAIDDLSFRAEPGRVTGFLGPNGAGKTTTLRCLVGLVRPTSGVAHIGGRRYHEIPRPNLVIGAALEATGFHPGRSARAHLRARAAAIGVSRDKVSELLTYVGLGDSADRAVGQYSLGMKQRLLLTMALVGDPDVLVLDEPANGLDPAGIAWLRQFLRGLAAEGRTILVSSHLLAEMRQTVDDVVIIDRGRAVAAGPLQQVVGEDRTVHVAGPDLSGLVTALRERGFSVPHSETGTLIVAGATAEEVGRVAWETNTQLSELTERQAELEAVFLRLTRSLGEGQS